MNPLYLFINDDTCFLLYKIYFYYSFFDNYYINEINVDNIYVNDDTF